jgi:hypothetical protein
MPLTDGNAEHSVAENFPPIQVEARVLSIGTELLAHTERRSTTSESCGYALLLVNRTFKTIAGCGE